MVFFIADTHFGDDNIRRYENRPFNNVEAMDEKMILNWNETVSDNDEIYLLGDYASAEKTGIISSLNGIKYLVKGNHDTESNEYYRNIGFDEVYDKPIILDGFWILSHEPLYINSNMPYANIFGHIHNSPQYRTFSSQHYCVSAERIDYTPINFEKIKAAIQKQSSAEQK